MNRATLIALALPARVDPSETEFEAVARVSLFLSPRLETDEGDRLDLFRDFLDWPAALRPDRVRFVVQVDGQDEFEARVSGSFRPRSDLWRALFRPDAFVRGRPVSGMPDRPLFTYPLRETAAYVKERYQDLTAAQPTALPSRDAVGERFQEVMGVARRAAGDRAALDRHLEATLGQARDRALSRRDGDGRPAIIAGDDLPEGHERDLTQFQLFYHRPAHVQSTLVAETGDQRRKVLDFHAALSALGDHPALLRQLGLVVDLEFDPSLLPPATPGRPRKLRARPVWGAGGPAVTVASPWVAYVHDSGQFIAAGRPPPPGGLAPEAVFGMVVLGNGLWDLLQLDVDGAGFKLLGMAASAAGRAAAPGSPPAGGAVPLPALRSAGLTLARSGTAAQLQRALVVHEQAEAGTRGEEEPFFAEDVTRGYRMDVFESRTGTWRSLHERRVSYSIPVPGAPPVPAVMGEGFLRRSVRQPTVAPGETPPPGAPLYVHDALCRWEGWSLTAPRPGKAISADPRAPDPAIPETQPRRVHNEAIAEGFPLEATVVVQPGTLPRLRFGESYRVRLRSVDLAGNGPSSLEADGLVQGVAGLVLPAGPGGERYRRLEPIGSPELVARAEVHEGESLARLVIRSDFDRSPEEWAAAHGGFLPVCERHVVPPKVSQLMAEQHGMFDAAIGTGTGVQRAYQQARKEKGSLADAQVLMSDGRVVPQQVTVARSPAGDYVINREARLIVPYLPDPLAGGVTVAGAPRVEPGTLLRARDDGGFTAEPSPPDPGGTPGGLVAVAFGAPERWPEVEPFRLQLTAGDAPPQWSGSARLLVIRLPKGGRARLQLSCQPPEDRLDQLGLRQWVLERLDAEAGEASVRAERRRVHDAAATLGLTWPVSPAREVELVHAVQRPVRAPEVLGLRAQREPGATFARLGGEIRVHGASSDRLDLLADWTDTVDRATGGGPQDPAGGPADDGTRTVKGSAHVLEVPIHLTYDTPPGTVDVGDPAEVPAGEYDEARDLVRLLAPPPGDRSGREFLSRHEFGDTRHRVVRYRAVATSRFREYFPAELAEDPANVSREAAGFEVSVPSSARPAAPRVLYVVPTFAWERGADPDFQSVHHSRRRGGGLRVYLDRPWFSSGAGEQLGVVLWPDADPEPPEAVQALVTRWGRDPLWGSPPTEPAPTPAHFPRATASAAGLSLAELAEAPVDLRVAVAGHEVAFDPARKLWYCDVEVHAGESYTPFVRLALARWQPHSLAGLELSRVVLAEYAQLAPDRNLSVIGGESDHTLILQVTLDGRSYRAGPGDPATHGGEVQVSVERRLDGTSGEVGWVDAMGDPGVTVSPIPVTLETSRWNGIVRLPAAGPGRHRLVVREYERFGASAGRRLVFAETLEL